MPDLGMYLQLLIGPTIPVPAPYSVMDAFLSLEVTNKDQQRDGFQMKFTLGRDTLFDYGLLASGLLNPPSRVIASVMIGFTPEVLIDGIITNHQITPSNKPGESILTVTGEDISLQLDLEEKNETYPNQPDSVIVTRLIASYATYGLAPFVTPTTDVPVELQRVPTQQGTDLKYIRQLAERNGFVFYIEPTAPFVNTAYWGPDNRAGIPQHALNMNMGADTNIDSLSFTLNALGPATPQVTIIEPLTKLPIHIPLPSSLHPPLASQPTPSLRKTLSRDSANLDTAQAALRALSTASSSSDAVTATGSLDGVRYGHVLRARKLVGVRGAGMNYDGNYYVKQVTHQIKQGEYKQNFTLTREGLGALTPAVVP